MPHMALHVITKQVYKIEFFRGFLPFDSPLINSDNAIYCQRASFLDNKLNMTVINFGIEDT